jgi:NADH-quinone oxidoreductase subunit E
MEESVQALQSILSEFDGKQEEIIPILQKVQNAYTYLPEESMSKIARFIQVPESRVYGVATFYAQFRFTPTGRNIVSICRGTACHVRGAPSILEETTTALGLEGEGTTEDLEYTVETVACIGCCALAPCVTVNEEVHGNLTKKKVRKLMAQGSKKNGS